MLILPYIYRCLLTLKGLCSNSLSVQIVYLSDRFAILLLHLDIYSVEMSIPLGLRKSSVFPKSPQMPQTMSTMFHVRIFLPSYILEFVSNDDNGDPKFDSQRFLSQASTSQVSEIISLIYPYVSFDEDAQEDDALVKKIYLELVAPNLCTLIIPKGLNPDQQYFQASIEIKVLGSSNFEMLITKKTPVNSDRILRFNYLVLCYLKNGQHRVAAHNLTDFVKTHKCLNEYELSAIDSALEDTSEGLQEATKFVQDSIKDIEGIRFLLAEPEISSSHRQELRLRIESATEQLKSNQMVFDSMVQTAGFINALYDYHRKLAVKHNAIPTESP